MTREVFSNTGFTGGMKATWDTRPYGAKEYDVANVDFEKFTIGLTLDNGVNILEIACEETTFTKL